MTDCIFCDEPTLPNDESEQIFGGKPAHRECIIRSVLGSVAHAQKRCRCFIAGSTEGDPIGMSKRDAARAAVKAHRFASVGAQLLNSEGRCPECGCAEFNPGPRGGRARNIRCASCGVKYWYCPPFQPQLIFFSDDEFYNTSVRHTLPFPEDV